MVAGLFAGHSVGYRLATPDTHERADTLAHSGHGYLDYAPLTLAVCLGLLLAALLLRAVASFYGQPRRPAASRASSCCRRLHSSSRSTWRGSSIRAVPWTTAFEPSFLVGLALQLPSALAALLLAWVLDSVAHAIGHALSESRPYSSRPLSPFPSASCGSAPAPGSPAGTENAHRPSFASRSFRWPRPCGLERRSDLRRSIALAVALVALAAAPSAFAHAILKESSPTNDLVVRRSPPTVTLRFSEAVETAFGSIRIYNCAARASTRERSPGPTAVSVASGSTGSSRGARTRSRGE